MDGVSIDKFHILNQLDEFHLSIGSMALFKLMVFSFLHCLCLGVIGKLERDSNSSVDKFNWRLH